MAIDDAVARGTTDSNGAAGMGRLGQQLLRLAVTICHAAKGSQWARVYMLHHPLIAIMFHFSFAKSWMVKNQYYTAITSWFGKS